MECEGTLLRAELVGREGVVSSSAMAAMVEAAGNLTIPGLAGCLPREHRYNQL